MSSNLQTFHVVEKRAYEINEYTFVSTLLFCRPLEDNHATETDRRPRQGLSRSKLVECTDQFNAGVRNSLTRVIEYQEEPKPL